MLVHEQVESSWIQFSGRNPSKHFLTFQNLLFSINTFQSYFDKWQLKVFL